MRNHEIDFTDAHKFSIVVNESSQVGGKSHKEIITNVTDFDEFNPNQVSVTLSPDVEQAKILVYVYLLNQCLELRDRPFIFSSSQSDNWKHFAVVLRLENCNYRIVVLLVQRIVYWLRWPNIFDVVNSHICRCVIHHHQRLHKLPWLIWVQDESLIVAQELDQQFGLEKRQIF